MQCHKVDYEIFGDDMQIVEVELDPGETVIAEAGAMNYMERGITFQARMGDGATAAARVKDLKNKKDENNKRKRLFLHSYK